MMHKRTVSGIVLSASVAALLAACGGGSSGGGDANTPQNNSGGGGSNGNLVLPGSYWELAGMKFVRSGSSKQASAQPGNARTETSVLVEGKLFVATVNGNGSTGGNGSATASSSTDTGNSSSADTTVATGSASSNSGATGTTGTIGTVGTTGTTTAGATGSAGSGTNGAVVSYQSAIQIDFTGRSAGTYQLVGTRAALENAGQQARLAFIRVAVHEGNVNQKRNTYVATGGSIEVTVGADGKFHISSTTSLPVSKTLWSEDGGATVLPDQTQMILKDVH